MARRVAPVARRAAPGGATGGTGGATGGTGGATGGTGGTGGTPCATIVINEVSVDGASGGDEFVELYNKGTCSAALSGYTLKYAAASATTGSNVWTAAVTDTLAAGGYFVIGGGSYTGAKNGSLVNGLAAAGGGVALYSGTNKLDGMAYGSALATHPYVEGTPTPTIPSNQSAARKPNGTDTNSNSADFKIGARSAGAANP
ncbi:MAG: lamin tail domain-containing protein [Polyangiaceae bacterium]